ncbi:hypothetical protein KI387_023951, partial [Taxus chinensis]
GDVRGHLGSLYRYRWEFDELPEIDIIWRPYKHIQWPEDVMELNVCSVEHFILGIHSYIIELYRVDRCQRQLGIVQGVPQPDIWYSHRDFDRHTMGHRIPVARAKVSFLQVVPQAWDPVRQVRDPGTIADYWTWYAIVLPRHLTIPEEAWAAGARLPIGIWHGAEQREGAAGHDLEDPFDGLPHDG